MTKKVSPTTILLCFGMFLPNWAAAADWQYFGRTGSVSNGMTYALDNDSIRTKEQTFEVWIQTQVTDPGATMSRVESKQLIAVNCDQWQMKIVHYVAYDSAGQATSKNLNDVFEPIVPETVGETLARTIC